MAGSEGASPDASVDASPGAASGPESGPASGPVSGASVVTVGDGVARISWPVALHEHGWQAAADVVRRDVAAALVAHRRVEALVDPDDPTAQRVATWSGLHREGMIRGALQRDEGHVDRILYARLATDPEISEPHGFRSLLNSFLPRKRAISQLLVRDPAGRVLLCGLTYKRDWDLPGGVVEVGESPRDAAGREIEEELGLSIPAGDLLLTDWLPPWGGWDDALCLVFDGGVHETSVLGDVVRQQREIREVAFCTLEEVRERAADFTTRRIEAVLGLLAAGRPRTAPYTESGR